MKTAVAESPLDPRAARTVERVMAGMETSAVAGIAEIVKLVEALAANALEISVQELAELIEKDLAVTVKVLAAANTLGYNPVGAQVSSISQAIHVIGFTKIRMLALSLLLMENAERQMPAAEQREAATMALSSGMLAQAWAEQEGRDDADQAFLCASLRNFGRLIMTAFLTDEYRLARLEIDAGSETGAVFRRIFGLTPPELGYELLQRANLAQPLLLSLRPFTADMARTQAVDPAMDLLVVAEFSMQMSELSLRSKINPEEFAVGSSRLCATFGAKLHVDAERMGSLLGRAEQRMNAFGRAFGLRDMAHGVAQRFAARREGRALLPDGSPVPKPREPIQTAAPAAPKPREPEVPKPPAPPAPVPDTAAGNVREALVPAIARPNLGSASPLPVAESVVEVVQLAPPPPRQVSAGVSDPAPTAAAPAVEPRPLIEVLRDGLAPAAEALAAPSARLDTIAGIVVNTLRDGWQADEVVLFLDHDRGSFAAFGGTGDHWRQFKSRMEFRRGSRDVLGVAASRCESVLIHDASDAKIEPYLPPWLKDGLQLLSCIIVPGGDAAAPHSMIIGGWRVRRKVHVTVEEARTIRALLGMAVTARRLERT